MKRKKVAEAVTHLQNGSFFILKPVTSTRGKIKSYKIRLLSEQGENIEGAWGFAKTELERTSKIKQTDSFRGLKKWIISN